MITLVTALSLAVAARLRRRRASVEASPRGEVREPFILVVLACSALAFAAAQTMVAPVLPAIGDELGVSTTTVSWVLTGFLISAALAPAVLGRLGDMFGKQRLLAVTLAILAAGSLVCALSSSIELLIVGRVVMGAGGSIFPLAFGIVRDELPAERVPTAIGLIAATFGVGGAAGTVLSGIVVDALDYRALFWIILAVALAALAGVMRYVPASPLRAPGRIDWPGALLLSASVVALLIAVSNAHAWAWSSGRTIGLLALAAACAAAWIAWQARAPDPFIDVRLLSQRTLAATNASSALTGFAMFATFIAIPWLVQTPEQTGYGFGASVTAAGLFLTPAALAMLIGAPIAGTLAKRSPRLPLLAGALLIAAALAILAATHANRVTVYAAMAIFGAGIGLSFAAQGTLTIASVAQRQTGAAGGMNTVIRTIGGALGAQIAASILAASTQADTPFPTDAAFTAVFVLTATIALAASAVALAVPRCSARALPSPADPGH